MLASCIHSDEKDQDANPSLVELANPFADSTQT